MNINKSDKFIAYLALISGLSISAVAIYYSVAGLMAIFAAAVIPIMIMGIVLEIGKLSATVWLKQNWTRAPRFLKTYLLTAIVALMLLTSMGIFGYLSKAHLDQAIPTGDVADKVGLIDEKIKTERSNIDAARKALSQMDAQVDQVLGRTDDAKGAERAVQIRRNQQAERTRLQGDIAKSQAAIAKLNEERAPIAKELRKVEAEVGPIKYIAALIYGDNPDGDLLERAVRWVIIVIVLVFDPLAVILLLASQYSFQWFRQQEELTRDKEEPSKDAEKDNLEEESKDYEQSPWPFPISQNKTIKDKVEEDIEKNIKPDDKKPLDEWNEMIAEAEKAVDEEQAEEAIIEAAAENEKQAMKLWKAENPENSVKHQRMLLERGLINDLPWEEYLRAKPDFSDDEAAEEAAKWAQEQLEKKNDDRGHYIGLDERLEDHISESEVKKKDNSMDGETGQSADNKNQRRIEGYTQNAEQNESTIWNRIKKG